MVLSQSCDKLVDVVQSAMMAHSMRKKVGKIDYGKKNKSSESGSSSPKASTSKMQCFSSGKYGHLSKDCRS